MVIGLAVTGLPLPLPTPSVLPTTAPGPVPSITTTIGSLLGQGSGSGATGGSATQPAQAPSAKTQAGAASTHAAPAATTTLREGSAPAALGALRLAQTGATTGKVQAARTTRPAGLPDTGAGPGGAGLPGPFAPTALAALVVLLGFFGLRMSAPKPVATRRYRLRVNVRALAPGAPAGAAADAATCLLESTLPAGFSVRRVGHGAVEVEAPILHRALLFNRLPEIAGRAGRVGLRLDWGGEPAVSTPAPRVRLALS